MQNHPNPKYTLTVTSLQISLTHAKHCTQSVSKCCTRVTHKIDPHVTPAANANALGNYPKLFVHIIISHSNYLGLQLKQYTQVIFDTTYVPKIDYNNNPRHKIP